MLFHEKRRREKRGLFSFRDHSHCGNTPAPAADLRPETSPAGNLTLGEDANSILCNV